MAKQRTEGAARRSFVKMCAFIALFLSALLFVFGGLFSGSIIGNVLNLIAKIALLLGIAFPAYEYAKGLHKAWRIIYWVCLVVYIAGCVLGMFSIKIG